MVQKDNSGVFMEEGNLRNTLIWTLCQLGLDYKLIQLKPAYPKISRNIPSAWNPGNDLKNLPLFVLYEQVKTRLGYQWH